MNAEGSAYSWLYLAGSAFLLILLSMPLLSALRALFQARKADVAVGFRDLLGMTFRRIPPQKMVEALIEAKREGLDLSLADLEERYVAGEDVSLFVRSVARNRSR